MDRVNPKITLYQEAKAGFNSLIRQTVIVALGFSFMLLLTGGNPPQSIMALSFGIGVGFVAWDEQKRLAKLRHQALKNLTRLSDSDNKGETNQSISHINISAEKSKKNKRVISHLYSNKNLVILPSSLRFQNSSKQLILSLETKNFAELINKKGFDPKTDLIEENLVKIDGRDFDLSGFDFRFAKLMYARLDNSKLLDSKFIGADLSGAILQGADLRGADFLNANLNHCDLSNTNLEGSSFRSANLYRVNFKHSKINKETVLDRKYRLIWSILNDNAKLPRILPKNEEQEVTYQKNNKRTERAIKIKDNKKYNVLDKTNKLNKSLLAKYLLITKLKLSHSLAISLIFGALLFGNFGLGIAQTSNVIKNRGVRYELVNQKNGDLESRLYQEQISKVLENSYLSNSDLEGAYLQNADLSEMNLSLSNLSKADLRSANLSNSNLTSANLVQAILDYADLTGADLTESLLHNSTVKNTLFGNNKGLSESMKRDLQNKGAIFEDDSTEYFS